MREKRHFNKKQMNSYVSIMSDVLETRNAGKISRELKKSGVNIKEKNVNKLLDDSFEIESRKIKFSCRMEDIFGNDV